jgi:hypothetical protein
MPMHLGSKCDLRIRWLSDFDKIEIKNEIRPLILKENAARKILWLR